MDINSLMAYGVLPLLVLLLLLVSVGFLALFRKPIPEGIKLDRYESGHVSPGPARVKLGFQYFGFLIIFATIEPIVVLLFVISPSMRFDSLSVLTIIGFSIAVVAPILIYAIRQAKKIGYWGWR